jgi:hypothetical protein
VWNRQGSTTISQHTYTLDNAGNRTQLAEQLAQIGGGTTSSTATYGYDHLYRLTSDSSTVGVGTYTYDPVDNRLSGGATTSLSYDRADRLNTPGCTVDANGNVTRLACVNSGQGATYDAANRLTSTSLVGWRWFGELHVRRGRQADQQERRTAC